MIVLHFIRDLYTLPMGDGDCVYYFPMRKVDQDTKETKSWAIVVTTDDRYAWEIDGEVANASAKLKGTELRDNT